MYDEVFKPLYAELPDARRYLERIGIESVSKPDRETLDSLVAAHQRAVPFENLDVYDAENDVLIDIPSLYDKIVVRRRGGYCFELNAAFMALLQSLKYECYAVAVRVVWHAECFMPLTHRATIVTIDGVRYFCDVGFGGPSPQGALMLDNAGEQVSGTNTFVISKERHGTVINRLADGEREPLLMFDDKPCDPVDFLALNEYQSKSKNSGFKKVRLLNLVTKSGSITLSGNVLKVHENGETTEKTLETEEELRKALDKYFGITVDFSLKMTI